MLNTPDATTATTLPVTASDILETSRSLRATADAAEALLLVKACEWADFHPALEDDMVAFPDEHVPAVHFDCTATFALNIGLSDAAGANLIHEALQLRHRLPRTWSRVLAGEVSAWRARRIAQRTMYQPADVIRYVDLRIAPIAHKIGVITLDRVIEETKMRLHPIETEQAQIDRLERREVWLDPNMSHEGVAHMEIRADFLDLFAFDKTVAEIAGILGDLGNTADLDVRRSLAIGVLADPQQAAELLAGDADALKKPSKRKHVQLVVHITGDTTTGNNPIGRLDSNGGMPILEQQIRSWCGRPDTGITILPVVDLAENIAVTQYEVPDRIKTQIQHRDLTCVFPHCTRPAVRSDNDHIEPGDPNGQTETFNIAALCRRHHRVKTHGGWSYQRVGPRSYLWTNQHGHQYLRDHEGTTAIERPTRRSNLPRAG